MLPPPQEPSRSSVLARPGRSGPAVADTSSGGAAIGRRDGQAQHVDEPPQRRPRVQTTGDHERSQLRVDDRLADRKKPSHNPSSAPIKISWGTSVTAPRSGSDASCDGSSGLGIISHLRARCGHRCALSGAVRSHQHRPRLL